jgi:nitrite reductase (NADH) large subunit
MLRHELEARGVEVILGAETKCVEGRRRVEGVTLTDGRTIPADLVVVAVGVRPNAEIARTAGLTVNRGIVVDDRLETSARGIYAIGECAEHNGQCYGIVEPAYEHARVLAQCLVGSDQCYSGSVLATNLKVSGVRVFSAGDFIGAAGTEALVLSDPGLKTYKKLVIANDRLVGAVLFGDTADGPWYLDLIRSGQSIDSMRDELVFGRAFAESICPQINHEQKLGKSQPERAASLTYVTPENTARQFQQADSA